MMHLLKINTENLLLSIIMDSKQKEPGIQYRHNREVIKNGYRNSKGNQPV